jgi:hypothetical protein
VRFFSWLHKAATPELSGFFGEAKKKNNYVLITKQILLPAQKKTRMITPHSIFTR